MNQRFRLFITALLLQLSPFTSTGQNSHKTDSLTNLLNSASDTTKVNILNDLSFQLYSTNSEKSTEYADQAVDLSRKLNYPYGIARGLNNRGLNYEHEGRLDKALECYLNALKTIEDLDYPARKASLLNNIGIVYFTQSDYEKACLYWEKSKSIYEQLNRQPDVAQRLINLGAAYGRLGKYDTAQKAYNTALEIFKAKNDSVNMVNYYINMGILIHRKESNGRNALPYYLQAEKISEEIHDEDDLLTTRLNIAQVYAENGSHDEAIKMFNQCLETAKRSHYVAAEIDIYSSLADIYAKINDYKNAYRYKGLFVDARDSMINETSNKQISELETKYKTAQKEKELQKQEIELSKSRNRVSLLSFLIITVIFFATLVTFFYRRKKIIATELEKAKSIFFSNIAHEFRTPVALITGPLENIIQETDDEQLKKKLSMPLRNAHHLVKLIIQLLDVTKLESGLMKLHLNYGELDRFIGELADHLQPMAAEKKIALTFTAPVHGLKACFDANSIEKIVYNLVTNAIKFTAENGHVDVSLSLHPEHPELILISVKDNGIGISAVDQKDIFKRFSRGRGVSGIPGFGLGLALVKELVTLNGGKISIESGLSKGSEFMVTLPLIQLPVGPDNEQQADEVDDEENADEKPMAVVIEDNPDMRSFIGSLLSGTGIKVYECKDGKSGLAKVKEIIPDIVITDIMLPDIDGYEICKTLKQDPVTDHIPVMMLTARTSEERRVEGIGKGADAYITKPFNPQELTGSVNNILSLRKKIVEKYREPAAETETALADILTTLKASQNEFVTQALAIIEKNLSDENFSVDQLSKEMYLSRAQFHRKIKMLTGFAASQLIRTIRLEKALELLRREAGNVTEIAFMTGFNSQPYFTKCFTQHFGYSPKEVKQEKI